jgi:hypothetical protein
MSPDSNATPSIAPAGLPPSGNSKYIIVVAVLVIGIAGLVAFKTCGPQPPASPQRPIAMYDAAPRSHDDDSVPLPPPIEEPVPDSGAPPRQVVGYDPCLAKSCSGTTTSELESALAYRAKQAHRCYDAALTQDSELKGRVSVRVRVASNGNVCTADVVGNDMGTDSVAKCVAATFRASRSFPIPKGNCVDVNVPMSFVPGGK